ncbi:MAG: AAA domain-containing protein, partial [Thermomicrobium sp.]
LVNSNTEGVIGSLHAEWRRLNVALSRARSLLVLLGDRRTFTAQKETEEEAEARERFRRVFARIDELARRGEARVLSTRTLFAPGAGP